jgi:formylglycine-generating enzyme required for sulfatase activity
MNTVTDPTKVDQKNIGLYPKFQVIRTDGKGAPGGKHEHDEYFVLNLTTDKHAIPALSAYAKACEAEYPLLASDLRTIVRNTYQGKDELVLVPETTLPNGTVVPSFTVGKYACSKSDIGTAIVTADSKPWHSINFHDAKKACTEAGYSLITELQYLAIAYQITQQDANWTGGKVGEGEVYRGIHKGDVDEAQNGHYVSEEPTERRWHALANGEVVYDFSGNIYSWVFDDVQGDENGIIAKPFADDSATKTTAPYGNREHGIGDTSTGRDWSGTALIRGGCWNSVDYAGVFHLYHFWPHYDYYRVGFRCTKSL